MAKNIRMVYDVKKQNLMVKLSGKPTLEFGRPSITGKSVKHEAIFFEINKYWESLSKEEQLDIYNIYEDVLESISSIRTPAERNAYLRSIFSALVDKHHTIKRIGEMMSDINVVIPDKVHDEYRDTHENERNITYIRDEYLELVNMTIVIRSLLPVWTILYDIENTTDPSARIYFTLETLRLLGSTNFIYCNAMERLRTFITAQYEKLNNDNVLGSVVSGLGTATIPDYLLASVIFDKLITLQIAPTDKNGNLITAIFQKIKNNIQSLGDRFQRIRNKSKSKSDGDEDDKIGYFESYTVRQIQPDDIPIMNQRYLQDYRQVRKSLDDTIPLGLMKSCIENFSGTKYKPSMIRPDQIIICQLVLSPVLNMRSIPHIEYSEGIANALGITQAALIHWHLSDIALMLSSEPVINEDEDVIFNTPFELPSIDVRNRLAECYPVKIFKRSSSSSRAACPGMSAIDELVKSYSDMEWQPKTSNSILKEIGHSGEVFRPSRTIKTTLAEMLIQINRITKVY